MADISNEIKIFREAVYGEEVRGGFISLAEKMNEVSEATETAEKKRVTAETGRVNAEKIRVSQETDRKNAETDRVSAETARASAESTRTSQESTRKSAETGRTNAEKNRVTQEEARKTAEKARASAESTRTSQESARASAETFRANAEKARGTAETGRVNAEQKRQTDTGSAIESCNTATDRANKAAQEAREATDKADAAAENIKEKIGINDKQPSDVTTYSGNKIEEMAQTNWIPEYMYDTVKGVRANWVYEKGKLVINDTEPEETGHSYVYIIVKVKTDTQYTVSWKSTRTGVKGGGVWVNGKDNSVIVNSYYSELNGSFTFDTGNNDQIRILFIGAAASNYGGKPGDSATFEEVMLVEGANKSNYVKNARDIVRECAEVRGEIGTIKAYDTLADVCKAFGIKTKPYTAAELLLALPRNIHVSFTNNKDDGNEYVTDAPVKYGIIDVNTGNSLSYNNAIISDSSNMNKIYRFKTDANTNNNDGWTKILTEQDIVANLTTTVTGKVLDALMGKKLKDEIDALNSTFVTELNETYNATIIKMGNIKVFKISTSHGFKMTDKLDFHFTENLSGLYPKYENARWICVRDNVVARLQVLPDGHFILSNFSNNIAEGMWVDIYEIYI